MQRNYAVELSRLTRQGPGITPLNRAELLEYLQQICDGDCYRRQTYYLAQHYIDMVLSR